MEKKHTENKQQKINVAWKHLNSGRRNEEISLLSSDVYIDEVMLCRMN